MPDVQTASLTKEKILSSIKTRGPSLPIQVAKSVNLSPLFASAFLSELYGERKIKISNMKVGSSPLYYIEGQESQLENFVEHLNSKEKEAFSLIKKGKVLEDDKQHPAIRVALRGLKDFAILFKSRSEDQEKVFWRYHLISETDANNLITKPAVQIKVEEKPVVENKVVKEEIKPVEKIKQNIKEIEKIMEKPVVEEKKQKKSSSSDIKFLEEVKTYLSSKDIELLQIISDKKKDFAAKIRIDTLLGKQEYYLFVKDKKKINEDDLTIALHKAQIEKMPALILSPGEIDKKSLEYLKTWNNLVKFQKVKF